MHNQNIKIREGRKEIIIFLDKFYPNEFTALEEAAKILQREVMYREAHPNVNFDR